jgi:hypothetical protein
MYEIEYICSEGTAVSAPKMFRMPSEMSLNIDPGTGNCFPPTNIRSERTGDNTARFEWDRVSGAKEYQLFYSDDNWVTYNTFTTTSDYCKITDLTASTKYEYKMRSRCEAGYSIFSQIGELSAEVNSSNSCDTLAFVTTGVITKTSIQLVWEWESDTARSGYHVIYKDSDQNWSDPYEKSLTDMTHLASNNLNAAGDTLRYSIDNLKGGTTYQFRVSAYCGTEESIANEIIEAKTKPPLVEAGDCGSATACDRSSDVPVSGLSEGDTIQLTDYTISITTLDGPNQVNGKTVYSGKGNAWVSLLGLDDGSYFDITFTNAFINENNCVVDGDDFTVDKIHTFVSDVVSTADEYKHKLQNTLDVIDSTLDLASQAAQQGIDMAGSVIGGDDVGHAKTGSLLGEAPDNTPNLVVDKGQVFREEPDGGTELVATLNSDYSGGIDVPNTTLETAAEKKVIFTEHDDATYDFDPWKTEYENDANVVMKGHYLKIDGVYFPAKAILPGEIDYVKVEFGSGINDSEKEQIHFINREGYEFELLDGNKLKLAGGPAGDAQEILAVTDTGADMTVLGALYLPSYEAYEKTVVIVPVGNVDISDSQRQELEDRMNEVYNGIGIHYTVEIDTSFKTDWCGTGQCGVFTPAPSGLLSNDYTGEEEDVIDEYTSRGNYDETDLETAYLFAVASPVNHADGAEGPTQGKMYFGKQFGFLYNISATPDYDKVGRTLAHEIAHGNYKLHHIFTNIFLGKGYEQYDNLMSYNPTATSLLKAQWDVIHDPGVIWGFAARDEDQEMRQYKYENTIELLRLLRFSKTRNVVINLPDKMPYARNIKIGNTAYASIKTEKIEQSNKFEVNGNTLIINTILITLDNNEEALKLKDFIDGTEINIYGKPDDYDKVINLNGESVSLSTISDFIENLFVELISNGKYWTLTRNEKLILDVPIIEWNLGYYYGAAFFTHWLKQNGVDIKLTDQNFTEITNNTNFFINHLNDAINEINDGVDLYTGDLTGICLERIKDTIVNGNVGDMVDIIHGIDYLNSIKEIPDFKSCFKIYSVSGLKLLDGINHTIDDDIVAALGSYSLNFNFAGQLEILGYDRAILNIERVVYRIWDSFDFNDNYWFNSQDLGYWKRDPFRPERPTTLYGYNLLENETFISFYNKVSANNESWDFNIISKYYDVNVDINGIDYSVDFFEKVTATPFK